MNLNKAFILGRLTADPQVRSTTTGQQVASFSVATNRVWYDAAKQKQEATEFHNIVVWGRQAEIAGKFLVKGALVLVEGRIQTRSWQDKSGQPRKTTEIIAERIQLGPRPGGAPRGGAGEMPAPERQSAAELPVIDIESEGGELKSEDLPF